MAKTRLAFWVGLVDISKRDSAVKHSQVNFLCQWYVIRKNGLHISLITHDRRLV